MFNSLQEGPVAASQASCHVKLMAAMFGTSVGSLVVNGTLSMARNDG